jgi:maleate cis-trans isomerase
LERDLKTTALTNVLADFWSALKFLAIREPVNGLGRLLEELP